MQENNDPIKMIGPDDILITSLKREELKILQEIGIRTFSETFEEINTAEDMQMYLEQKFNLQQILKEYENPESEFYLAWVNGKIAGYLKINTGSAQNESFMPHALEVERIYVLKEFYGKGIGQFLLDKAIEIARQKQVSDVWLGVWEDNYRAIRFYEKNGFERFDSHAFMLGDSVQTDDLMKLSLT